jgi:hypothetical protein
MELRLLFKSRLGSIYRVLCNAWCLIVAAWWPSYVLIEKMSKSHLHKWELRETACVWLVWVVRTLDVASRSLREWLLMVFSSRCLLISYLAVQISVLCVFIKHLGGNIFNGYSTNPAQVIPLWLRTAPKCFSQDWPNDVLLRSASSIRTRDRLEIGQPNTTHHLPRLFYPYDSIDTNPYVSSGIGIEGTADQ